MPLFGNQFQKRRSANLLSIQKAFGVTVPDYSTTTESTAYRTVRTGSKTTVFTIGYERRTGLSLIALLQEAGVDILADIREKPMSRVPDFRASALRSFCTNGNISYEGWPELGSTEKQRDQLKSSGDFHQFATQFRKYAIKNCAAAIERLSDHVCTHSIALLCYEREHEECHRSIIADLVAERTNATIIAL